jgi:hypothetical protein
MAEKVDFYGEQVKKILKEVERIFRDEASMSHGVKIVIEMGMDRVPQIRTL